METYNASHEIVPVLEKELQKLKVPWEFVHSIKVTQGRKSHGFCYPILEDNEGNRITKIGVYRNDMKKYKLVGVHLEVEGVKDLFHEVKHAQQLFYGGLTDYLANPLYREIEARCYELRRGAEEDVRSFLS